ncbi:MAG: sialate O-acetylesterase [Lachnospiraceae bacterium]|nr:sialate O-acetylesterase [Lachnospiraceae bacterium]
MSQYYNRPLEFRVMKVFSNHMVLQREKNIHVFGEGEQGTEVAVTLTHTNGEEISATAVVENDKWLAILPPQQAAKDCTLTVEAYKVCEDGEKREKIADIKYTDVAIGEVWLAGGQSNMELELKDCAGGQDTLKQDVNPNVRFYYTQKYGYKNKDFYEAEERSGWQEFGEESARAWSAVGYYFARKLSRDLDGITVGVIGCNWGGTSASAWMSREALLEDKELATYVQEFEKACEGLTVEEQEEAYDKYEAFHAEWDKKCGQLYVENPNITWAEVEAKIGPCQWPGPMNVKNPFRPAGLYECMLQRVCPYSMRGFLFYQGESDDHKPRMYYKLFTRMIRQWREDFLDDEMPFLMVQLTMHRYQYDEDFKHWPIIREAQMDTYKTIKNTGIAVIIDRGEFNEIHPKDKLTVGERLTLQALAKVYGTIEEKDAFGPVYDSSIYHEDSIELCFKYAEDGFKVKGEPAGFEIAGYDRKFVAAEVKIEGSRIFVSAPEVVNPRYVRYLWTNYAEVTLFGKNGIPVSPFRTCKKDEEIVELQRAKIQQIMEV